MVVLARQGVAINRQMTTRSELNSIQCLSCYLNTKGAMK